MIEKQIVGGSKRSTRPERQRALVLQGGGALGAYEVGAIKCDGPDKQQRPDKDLTI